MFDQIITLAGRLYQQTLYLKDILTVVQSFMPVNVLIQYTFNNLSRLF